MTLQTKLTELYTPFLELNCDVSHYKRLTSNKFVVWAETGEADSAHADNHKTEQQLTGFVDFFTLEEFDPIADDIQGILNEQPVGWTLEDVLYEEETNLIHYTWRWWTSGKTEV